jgi:hypothetical protein
MVMWELWECKTPFSEFTSRFDIMDAIRKGMRPELSADCPEGYRKLYLECVAHDPGDRPNFGAIVQTLKSELTKLREGEGRSGASTGGASGGGNHQRSESFAQGFGGLYKNSSLDWLTSGGNMSYRNASSLMGGRSTSQAGGGGGMGGGGGWREPSQDSDGLMGPPQRKHSIVSNVLASPVLQPLYGRKGEDLYEEELENLVDPRDTVGSSPMGRNSF